MAYLGPKWPFLNFNKVPFVGTLKLYQEMPDIIQIDLTNFYHKSLATMAEKWPENGLLMPKMAIFEVSTKYPLYQEMPDIMQQ